MPLPSADTLMSRLLMKAKVRHMQVLVTLAEIGSMRRAADALHMTQPAVSQMVAELERLLEIDLFFRHARGVEPTEATKDLLPIAQRIIDAVADGSSAVSNRLQHQAGIVRVSASAAAMGGMIHGALDSFATRHPDIEVMITEAGASAPLAGIIEAATDLICTREPNIAPKGWAFQKCIDDALIVACGAQHPLAKASQISWDELGQQKWLMNRVGSIARRTFEGLAQENGWPNETRCQIIAHVPRLTLGMLETGKYLAILPRSVAMPWFDHGRVLELKVDISSELQPLGYLYQPNRAGPAAETFAAHIRAFSAGKL